MQQKPKSISEDREASTTCRHYAEQSNGTALCVDGNRINEQTLTTCLSKRCPHPGTWNQQLFMSGVGKPGQKLTEHTDGLKSFSVAPRPATGGKI